VFEESLATLNLSILLPPPLGGVLVEDPPNTIIETQHNKNSLDEHIVQDSTDDILRNDNQQIYCTKEAMEISRHCHHGQFLALLALEFWYLLTTKFAEKSQLLVLVLVIYFSPFHLILIFVYPWYLSTIDAHTFHL
jgi:hypothetical protein